MDSHRFDTIVLGGELSAFTAAALATRSGQQVAMVLLGPGSFVLDPAGLTEREVKQAGQAPDFFDAITFFRDVTAAAGCPFEGNIGAVHLLPTILGELERIAFAPSTLWNAEPRTACPTAIVGVAELASFDENFMAERLNEQARRHGVSQAYEPRRISLAHSFGGPVTTTRVATYFDNDPAFRAQLLYELVKVSPGFKRILVPAMLGLHTSADQLAQFEKDLDCALGELPTLPPSISSLRLFHRLRSYIRGLGVELFEGYPVKQLETKNQMCTKLTVISPGRALTLQSASIVQFEHEVNGLAAQIHAGYRAANAAVVARGQLAAQ